MVNPEIVLSFLGQRPPRKGKASPEHMRNLVRRGMPAKVLHKLAEALGVSLSDLQGVVGIPRTTASRQRSNEAILKPILSDRAYRVAWILALAVDVLESRERAAAWLREPNRALGGHVPFSLLDTETGARDVETVLMRIEHGIYS